MDEKQPTFTVTDRRKFTLEGELRDEPAVEQAQEEKPSAPAASEKVVTMPAREDRAEPDAATGAAAQGEEAAAEAEMPQFSAQERADQHAAYQASSQHIDDLLREANPEMGATGVIAFEHIIQSFYVSAMLAMGAGTEPGQKARIDILGARQSIDMLALLEEKTKGNLTQKEEATLKNVLFELRMMFLELTNAIAQQAQRPADGKKK
ncbi:MAG TPA: DUF1844 domain-containing protein [Acidobacteriaceae bacterium]|jgi:hypothetical protein|nr:DUF1844 domain-containing protein [Acidobacteriaceae bacterium]